ELGERAGGGTAALRRVSPLDGFGEQAERAVVAGFREPAIRVLADHVGVRVARRGLAQQLAGARVARLAEREARLGLDEVARVALLDDRGERATGVNVVDEVTDRARDRAASPRVDLGAQPLDQLVARGLVADLREPGGRDGAHGPELVALECVAERAFGGGP